MTRILTWKDHITTISQKISKSCGIIYRTRNNWHIKRIYYSLIHPYLTCRINVWSSKYQTNQKSANTAKNNICAHTLCYNPSYNLIRQISSQIKKMLPLAKLIKFQEGILANKVNSDQYLLSNFLTDGHVDRRYHSRNNADLRIPLHVTTDVQQFICYKAIKTWNNLPDNLCSSSSLHSFKTKLKLM